MSWFCNLKGILSSLVLLFALFITEISAFARSNVFSLFPSFFTPPLLPVLAAAEDDVNSFSIFIPTHIETHDVPVFIQSCFEGFSEENADLRTAGVTLPQERNLIINITIDGPSVELFHYILSAVTLANQSRDAIFRYSTVSLRVPRNAFDQADRHFLEFLTGSQNERLNFAVSFFLQTI